MWSVIAPPRKPQKVNPRRGASLTSATWIFDHPTQKRSDLCIFCRQYWNAKSCPALLYYTRQRSSELSFWWKLPEGIFVWYEYRIQEINYLHSCTLRGAWIEIYWMQEISYLHRCALRGAWIEIYIAQVNCPPRPNTTKRSTGAGLPLNCDMNIWKSYPFLFQCPHTQKRITAMDDP